MQKWMIALTTAASLALAGCSSTCDRLSDATDAYAQKVKPCLSSSEQTTAFNVNQCDRAIEKCTDSERKALDEYVDCVKKLQECTPGTKDAFTAARRACNEYLESKAGDVCLAVFD
jgi:hypothetical protein